MIFPRPVTLHLGFDGWQEVRDRESGKLGLGLNGVRLIAEELAGRSSVELTWRWRDDGQWLGEDFRVRIVLASAGSGAVGFVRTREDSPG